jgi:hypothetical protein
LTPRPALPISAVLLLGANAVPLLGVLFLGWDLFSIMILYWAENGIIGLLNIPKILLASGEITSPDTPAGTSSHTSTTLPATVNTADKLLMIPFFVLHYGLFWAVHGVFVFALFGPARGPTVTVALCALILFASHAASFLVNCIGHHEYLKTSPSQQMSQPYSRILVLHFTILGRGFLTLLLGAPAAALAVLVAIKTITDLRAHAREYARASATASTPS